jgi:phosphatidate cytidylyltransferase
MLRLRVVTAVVLLVVLLGALLWSRLAFELLAGAAIAAALWEWLRLIGWSSAVAAGIALTFVAVVLATALLAPTVFERTVVPLSALALVLWAGVALWLVQPEVMELRMARPGATGLALVFLGAAWSALDHFLAQGAVVLLSVFVIVWLADTAAYFCGRAFGRTKLAPHISPGKTWAGVVGAVVVVLAVSLLAWHAFPDVPLFTSRLLTAFAGGGAVMIAGLVAVSIVGDLFESLNKRQAGAKDSSGLLPGHGGVLDRIDALLPVLPLAVVLEWMAR